MPVPSISSLPATPSRIGDPDNFFAESLALLSAQVTFVTQCNAVAAYLNAAKWNVNDWGLVTDAVGGGSPVAITNFPLVAPTNPPLTGLELVSAIDSLLVGLAAFVADGNAVAAYIDTFVDPLADPVSEPTRPSLSLVTASPVRTDAIATFNSKALAFYNSARAFALSLQALADYVTAFLSGSEDWLGIADAITSTDDWGLIT